MAQGKIKTSCIFANLKYSSNILLFSAQLYYYISNCLQNSCPILKPILVFCFLNDCKTHECLNVSKKVIHLSFLNRNHEKILKIASNHAM
jgi:hypothetical protein